MIVARDNLITDSEVMTKFWNKIWSALSTKGLAVTGKVLFGDADESASA